MCHCMWIHDVRAHCPLQQGLRHELPCAQNLQQSVQYLRPLQQGLRLYRVVWYSILCFPIFTENTFLKYYLYLCWEALFRISILFLALDSIALSWKCKKSKIWAKSLVVTLVFYTFVVAMILVWKVNGIPLLRWIVIIDGLLYLIRCKVWIFGT